MKGLLRAAVAAVLVVACSGGDLTGPNSRQELLKERVVLAVGTDPTTGATIETNKDDYVPGEVVHVVGRGWAPNETVNLHMTEEPDTHADVDTNVVADANGDFSVHYYDVQPHDLGVTFSLTATGSVSHSVAIATFTDGNPGVPTVTVGQNPNPVIAGNSATYTVQVTYAGNSSSCTVLLSAAASGSPLWPAGASFSFSPPTLTGSGGASLTSVLTVSTPAGMPANTYHFTVTEARQEVECQGPSSRTSVPIDLVVSQANTAPAANAGGPYTSDEASSLPLNGSGSDPDVGGSITAYAWTYGKNTGHAGATCVFSNVAVEDPTFTCNDNGTFTVSLTVTDDKGATSTPSTASVTVNNVSPTATNISTVPPSPGFGANFTATLNGGDDVSTNDETVGLQYRFDCGAGYGAFGASNSTTCTASSPNSQTVKATIRDKDGGENEYQTVVTIGNAPPVANAGGNKSGTEGSPVSLDGTSSTDPDGNITTYAWSFTVISADPGADCVITNGNQQTASITCDDDGSVSVTLTVTDDDGATNAQTVSLPLANADPTASAGGPYTGAEGSAIQLGASADDPGDNDDATLTYAWTVNTTGIDGGGSCVFSNPNIANPTITCTDDGNGNSFPVSVLVSDGDGGSKSAQANLAVSNANPVANAGTSSGAEGSPIQLNGSANDPGDNDDGGLTYEWSMSTSGIDAGGSCSLSNANIANPTVTCSDDSNGGTFTLSLTVKDDDGGSHTDTGSLTVTNANPTADAHGPYSGVEGSAVLLNGSGDDPASNDDGVLTYLWSVNTSTMDADASCTFAPNASAQNPTVTCNDDTNGGTVQLTLKVMDDDGGQGTQSVTLSLTNAQPVALPGGPYSDNEGAAIQLSGAGSDPGENDEAHLTYQWSVTPTGIDNGGTCSLSNATAQNPTVTCTDDSNGGEFTVSLAVSDDDGATSTMQTANLTVANVNPVADANGPYSGVEGANVSLTGAKSDAGTNDTHTYAWTWVAQSGVDAGATCAYTTAVMLSPTVKCTDDGVFKLTLTVTDDDGGSGSDYATLTLSNKAPTISITSHVDGALFSLLNGPVAVTGTIADDGSNDTHQCRIELQGPTDKTGVYSNAVGSTCSPSVLPDEAGVYTLTIRVKDDEGDEDTAFIMVVVYDPSAGFVTGGGWINSPAGAYKLGTTLTGKATFGFVSKYKKGANVPEGNTEFQFHAGGMNFHSSEYEWLVVNQGGTNAQFKGVGTINGQGSYTFMIWATDNGNSGDTFRIKITDNNNGNTAVYDNGVEQVIAGGSIVIHTGGNGKK